MKYKICIIPGTKYTVIIENTNEDGYKVVKEKEFASVEEVLIELGEIL